MDFCTATMYLKIHSCTCQPRSTKIWRCLEVLAFATCTSPIVHLICPPKFCIAFVFHFSWVLQPSQEELKTTLMQNFGEQMRCIMADVQVANWKNVIFDNVWILSENHPKAFWMFPTSITAFNSRANFLRCIVQFDWLIPDQLLNL